MSDDPLGLLLGGEVEQGLEKVRDALQAEQRDPYDRDAFLMSPTVVELIREARPDTGYGETIDQVVALLHLAYLYWQEGRQVVELDDPGLETVLAAPAGSDGASSGPPVRPPAYYVRLPPRRVWASPVEGQNAEPLDGWLAARTGDLIRLVALFGVRPDRDGATVVAAEGSPPGNLAREDGTALFAPVLPGGAAAGLYSIVGTEELLELAWRVERRRINEE
ncbi:MAG TPA: hypothetical protein VGA78_15400 [Gemmatimonadales bacterium]|jgi:hypothetical protein